MSYKYLLLSFGSVAHGKILVVEFTEYEEQIFNDMLVWLSDRMPVMPITIQQSSDSFSLNKFTRTMANENT